jgi:predicted nucleotidyltransferase
MPSRSSGSSGVVFLDRERAVDDVRRTVAALVGRRSDVREVWLFGSLARGRATPRSDADLLIVVDEDARRPMDRIPEFLVLLEGIGRPADVVVVTVPEWKAREGTALHRQVVMHGIQLHPLPGGSASTRPAELA